MSLFVYLVTLLALAAVAASRAMVAAAAMLRARAERRRFSEPAPADLRPGRVELAGTVEVDPPDAPAIAVRIRQQAFEGGTSRNRLFDWKEQDRAVDARPFTLVLHGTGARVDVLPAGRPILLAHGVINPTGERQRVLTAALRHGERARVAGLLAPDGGDASGYREAPRRLVLQGQEGERLRVEAESALWTDVALSARRRLVTQGLHLALLFCGPPAAWTTLTLARSATVTATVMYAGTCTGRTKNGSTTHYACFRAVAPDGHTQFEDMHGTATTGSSVRISYARDFPFRCSIGEALDPDLFSTMFMGMGVFMLAVLGMGRTKDERRWFDTEPFDSQEAP